ncbi:MAG TPA: hypothetical protein VFQ40_01845 [Actinomycetota bacterium]|nr:hypothetical protein [Actinomycetota bacterium]
MFGAGTALIVSFVALSTLWREPRFEHRREGASNDSWLQRLLTNTTLEWAVRIVVLVFFAVVAGASAMRAGPRDTIGPIVVFAWFWVGIAFASAIVGNVWATISPFDTLGRLLGLDDDELEATHPYPTSWGLWPAAIQLLLFVWLELVDPFGGVAGSLGIVIVAYTLVQIAGMHRYGRRAWIEHAEAFAVYFGLLARIAPLARDREGRVVTRPPLAGLARVPIRPGLLAVVMVALGSTTYDGFSRSQWWVTWTAGVGGIARPAAFTVGLLAVIGLVTLAYVLAMLAAGRVAGADPHVLAVRFAPSLVPIVLAYVVAHYFSFLVLEGQLGLIRLSDPFGQGWDLFGTAGWAMNLALVSPTTIWYVQVAAIVIGHVGGVIVAHDRAIASFPPDVAVRTQYALLAVMVLFTVSGLLILSG